VELAGRIDMNLVSLLHLLSVKQVFAEFDVLGWYLVTTAAMSTMELDLHQRVGYNVNLCKRLMVDLS
jgi:hypothetical protein